MMQKLIVIIIWSYFSYWTFWESCLFFESCNSPADVTKFFTQTMLRAHFNSLRNIFADFDDSCSLSVFYQKRFSSRNIFSVAISLEYVIFINNVDNKIFRYIYESFVPLQDYNSTCFKPNCPGVFWYFWQIVPPCINPDRKMLLTWNLTQSYFVMLQKFGKKKNQNYSYSDDDVTNYVKILKNYV